MLVKHVKENLMQLMRLHTTAWPVAEGTKYYDK